MAERAIAAGGAAGASEDMLYGRIAAITDPFGTKVLGDRKTQLTARPRQLRHSQPPWASMCAGMDLVLGTDNAWGREPMRTALSAPTATERIAAAAAAGRQIMQRAGELFAVAQQAAALEPLVAEAWQQGREQSHHVQRLFWTGMAHDGLLPPSRDLDWIIDTASLLTAAETYLLITRLHGWALDTYETWLRRTLTQLVGTPYQEGSEVRQPSG